MKKVKMLLVIFILLLLSGCSVDYNLVIKNSKIFETYNFTIKRDDDDNMEFLKMQEAKQIAYYDEDKKKPKYYYQTIKEKETNIFAQYKYEYNFPQFEKARVFDCYKSIKYFYNEKYLTINTSQKFGCLEIASSVVEDVTVFIKTDYKVIKHNADEVKDNNYIWNINHSNYTNKPIQFIVQVDNKEKSNKMYITIIIVTLLLTLMIYLIIKSKRVNRFE